MSNRTVLVDNNTWNNTHIASVAMALASPEKEAYFWARDHDVDYVMVCFGGLTGYAGDDINKFLWMIRIAGTVYPEIVEADYLSKRGELKVDADAPAKLQQSLL